MNVLVLGGGGREHALAWRLARDKNVTRVLATHTNRCIRRPLEAQRGG